jgi:hypothetical protein
LVDAKTRTNTEFGAADRAVDAEKRQPLCQPHTITPRRIGVDLVAGEHRARHWRSSGFGMPFRPFGVVDHGSPGGAPIIN